ncbi:MAG TPA: hypothetical protein VIJ14_08085 [Rhabdochlamydiaceae bacterium]
MKEPTKGSGKLSKVRSKPGESNAFKYKGVKSFAGPDKTYPINTKARGRNALARAHFASNPSSIRAKVHAKYPSIGKKK